MSPRSEQELLDATVDLAIRCQWAVHHDLPSRRAGARWSTLIQGHAGFPDLVLARAGVVLFRELKGYDVRGRIGRLSSEQRDWGRQIEPGWPWAPVHVLRHGHHPGPRGQWLFDVWTPDDWDTIIRPTLTVKPQQATA